MDTNSFSYSSVRYANTRKSAHFEARSAREMREALNGELLATSKKVSALETRKADTSCKTRHRERLSLH